DPSVFLCFSPPARSQTSPLSLHDALPISNALELGSQHVAFQPALPLWRDVLETAAAADTEMTAGRLDPIRRWLQHLHHFGLDDATAAAQRAEQDPFAGQSAPYEDGLAVDVGHAPPFGAERGDVGFGQPLRPRLPLSRRHRLHPLFGPGREKLLQMRLVGRLQAL